MDHTANIQFDPEKNSKELSLTKDIYLRILNKALIQTDVDIKTLEAAITGNDTETIKALTHRFKGDFDNMRITALAVIAKEMNNSAKSKPDQSVLLNLLQQFKVNFERLKELIKL